MKPEPPSRRAIRFVKEPDSGEDDEIAQRLRGIEKDLAEIFFRLVKRRREKTGISGKTPNRSIVGVKLELPAPDAPAASNALDGQLEEQLRRTAERLADHTAVFPSGKVYCYWCRSFECEHAEARECREVFYGYSATGQPLWSEFASVLLERRDPRVDLLYREPPARLTLTQPGDELAGEQLQVYGRGSGIYRVLGQVAVGYLGTNKLRPDHGATTGSREHYALTFQAVQGGDGAGGLLLNVIGRLPDGKPALEVIEESADPRVADAITTTRRRLGEVMLDSVPRRRRSRERKRRALDILRRLAKNLDRIFRQRTRRTRHSNDRRRNKARPTSKALADAIDAKRGSIYRDVEEHTWIVIGPKARVHVFNDDGLHITSVVYPGETVRHRTRKGKWLKPRDEELDAFRIALSKRSSGEFEEPGEFEERGSDAAS